MDHRSRHRTRSRSPVPNHHHRPHRDRHARRSRSPNPERRKRHHHHRHDRDRDRGHGSRHSANTTTPKTEYNPILPFHSPQLGKHDLPRYEPLFAMYLDIQKGIVIDDIPDEEVRGRWKSFVGKWNRGELAEGWYDPVTLRKARSAHEGVSSAQDGGLQQQHRPAATDTDEPKDADEESEEEEYGPNLPKSRPGPGGPSSGPTIPTVQDLQLRKESAIEESESTRKTAQKQHRAELRSHRSTQRDLQDEVAPRAEPRTHERRVEKQRENAAANRSFAEARRGGSPTDAAPEEELMGSGEGDLQTFKREKEKEERKKNEREIKREEILRARAVEREERVQRYRQKEDETIGWLKTLAKQRFG